LLRGKVNLNGEIKDGTTYLDFYLIQPILSEQGLYLWAQHSFFWGVGVIFQQYVGFE
jgi:hypothetical protein